jgi:hypothetical protein
MREINFNVNSVETLNFCHTIYFENNKSEIMRLPCCLYVCVPPIVARERFGKHVPAEGLYKGR